MIIEIDNSQSVEHILKAYFKTYKKDDFYEKLAIYKENEVKGIISYSIIYERAEINYILTLPEFRKQGISQKLLNYALNKIIRENCISVSLEVDKNNSAAINLYLKNGFVKAAVRKNYYNGQDAYLMIKELVVEK